MNGFVKFYAFLQYRRAVQMADKAHEENGARFYVMPNARGKIRLIVTDRKNFRRLRMKHYIDSNVKMEDVLQHCFYYTPYASGDGAITEAETSAKLARYYAWVDRRRKRKSKPADGKRGLAGFFKSLYIRKQRSKSSQ